MIRSVRTDIPYEDFFVCVFLSKNICLAGEIRY